MWRLYQFPLCPFSRKLRLLLAEKGVSFELVRENPWEMRDEFFLMNPTGRTPVMREPAKNITLSDSRAIAEYFEETIPKNPMINGTATNRAEIRRLMALFDENFFGDVTGPLLMERYTKRVVARQAPNSTALRNAMRLADEHLDYVDYLIDHRPWLAGSTMSLADLTAAAQISVADYLGGINWQGHEQARSWYSVFKSRPSFQPLLADRMEGVPPPRHYSDINA
ncbi:MULTISPECIES: glutathione S-transferase family protein [Croceicoccus]|uniref:Glutathione S-transferase n=1 Tax=Croceicoccus pelagius TaxID=1703341 RepID=A0A916YJV4_9SPHN|nr:MULTISPECIES: glutathione S-transferase family protein [Croceicoccus]MBS7670860.1 glutathione S-transferase family protein [Croceicoccus gelatinilyticus]GGD48862.1 glutathione S-transferase [Croceicoccus pelagius]